MCFKSKPSSSVRRGDIHAKCVVTDAFEVKLTNHNRTQKWRLNLVDGGNEPLLPCKPPDPQANAIGNNKWCKRNRQNDDEQEQQNTENDAIP